MCPNCGEFTDQFNSDTGWCTDCTPPIPRFEKWLTKYEENIEDLMQEGLSAQEAITKLLEKYRAVCIVCRDDIPHGTFGRHFICSKNPECKKARRRYKYLIYDKGLNKRDALEQVIRAL